MTLVPTKAVLECQLVELRARQQRILSSLATPLPQDASDRATEMEDDAGLEAEAKTIAQEIASVERALARMRDGSYGICVRCGEKIGDERLLARPEAALCIGCARRL